MTTCTDCGHQIPPKRLRARPNATRCCECQQRVDLYVTEADVAEAMAALSEMSLSEMFGR